MTPNATINSETICDLEGKPIDRNSTSMLKAIDKLLTVGAYYSNDHDQYLVISEEVCTQMVEAMAGFDQMAIEITAQGMMVRSQLVDPRHRNVRLLYELLVPLNIARFEISSRLTPADLRQAVTALQDHRRNLGNNTGFQEIVIKNLPPTVSTAARNVVRDGEGEGFSLEDFGVGSDSMESIDLTEEPESESEKLARLFIEIVNKILENLEQGKEESGDQQVERDPRTTPENLQAIKESLKNLVDINPDPKDLSRLIEHAQQALSLSRNPDSVDLVFSLLKKELSHGGDRKKRSNNNSRKREGMEFSLNLDQLMQAVVELEEEDGPSEDPGPSSLDSHLGVCFSLLGSGPSEVQEIALIENLNEILSRDNLSERHLSLSFEAVKSSAIRHDRPALDRVMTAFCEPIRRSHPQFLAESWERLWSLLPEDRQSLVWPHFLNDLMLGIDNVPAEVMDRLWLSAGTLDPKIAVKQVKYLENQPAFVNKVMAASLTNLPPEKLYAIHLAMMKSSMAPKVGPRLHFLISRKPANGLTEFLLRGMGKYDSAHTETYLALIKYGNSEVMPRDLQRMALKMISANLADLPPSQRTGEWAREAILWIGKLDPGAALPLLTRIRDQKKFFFFKVWPERCRRLAGKVISEMSAATDDTEGTVGQ